MREELWVQNEVRTGPQYVGLNIMFTYRIRWKRFILTMAKKMTKPKDNLQVSSPMFNELMTNTDWKSWQLI
jgi:hypothetical protein